MFAFVPVYHFRMRDYSWELLISKNGKARIPLCGAMGKGAFFFAPDSKVVDGQLLFTLLATTSTGNPEGRYASIPITDPEKIQALKMGGAYWYECADINDRSKGTRKIPLGIKSF
jgi:hypothetical protein